MNNCKPTIIINNVEYASEKRIDSSSSLEAIVQSLLADPLVFASIKEALNNPLNGTANLESFNDLVHVIPSNSDLNKVSEFLETTGRTYQPVLYSIQSAINIINKFGKPKILWIDGDIQLKGTSIPKYLVSNIGEDLIILKSHKLEDINNTLQEYIYNVVLGNEGGELLDIINLRFPNSNGNDRISKIISTLSPSNIFSKLLYDDEFNRFIDTPKSATDKKRTLRQELNEHIQEMLANKDKTQPKYFKLTRVISGGQTGIDMLGVQVAKSLGYETGGTLPPRMKQETHTIIINPDTNETKTIYGLTPEEAYEYGFLEISPYVLSTHERSDSDYVPRTEENVKNSDGTIYFLASKYDIEEANKFIATGVRSDNLSGGFIATYNAAKKLNKPFKVIDWQNPGKAVEELQLWMKDNNIRALNIAGSRGSSLTQDDLTKIEEVIRTSLDSRAWIERKLEDIISYQSNPYTRTNFPEELSEEEKNAATSTPISMFMDYGNNSRDGLKSKSTFEAILREERTSTTRYNDSDPLTRMLRRLWTEVNTNHNNPVIAIFLKKEDMKNASNREGKNIIYARVIGVEVITPLMALDLKDGKQVSIDLDGEQKDFVLAWTNAEGWSEKYLREKVAQKILDNKKPAVWIRYRLVTADIPSPPKFGNRATTFIVAGTDIKFDGSLKSLTDALLDKKGVKQISKLQREALRKQVQIVFDRMPQLKKAVENAGGNLDEYLDYLLLVYPDSVEKSIYWHGTDSNFTKGFPSEEDRLEAVGTNSTLTEERDDFYLAKLPWTTLLYVGGINRSVPADSDGYVNWNKLYWELKEIMSNGRRLDDNWKNIVIGDNPETLRTKIPNKRGDDSEGHGFYISDRKRLHGLEESSDREYFEKVFGIKWNVDTFNTWLERNSDKFKRLLNTPNDRLPNRTSKYGGIFPAIINVTNPYRELGRDSYYKDRGVFDLVDSLNNDAILGSRTDNEFHSDVAIIINITKNLDKVHFLGTSTDIESYTTWRVSKLNTTSLKKKAEGLAERILTGKDSLGNNLDNPLLDLLKQIDEFIGCN